MRTKVLVRRPRRVRDIPTGPTLEMRVWALEKIVSKICETMNAMAPTIARWCEEELERRAKKKETST